MIISTFAEGITTWHKNNISRSGTAQRIRKRPENVCQAGIHSGRGGVWYKDQICEPYHDCCNDDDLVLYLSKHIKKFEKNWKTLKAERRGSF